MNARKLLDKFAAKEKQIRGSEFISPYTKISDMSIVRVEGVLYKFKIFGFIGSGIGVFKPKDGLSARFVRDAEYSESRVYFDALPSIHLSLVFQADEGWAATPTSSLSSQKVGFKEIMVLGVSDCQRFDVVTARFDGSNFWYDEIFVGADPIKAEEMRDLFEKSLKGSSHIKGMTPEDHFAFEWAKKAWENFKKVTTKEKVEQLLANGGARLGGYVTRGQNIEVTWRSVAGSQYTSVVNKDTFDVVTAGICLNGDDQKFHLKDLPGIIETGERDGLIYRTHRHGRHEDWE